MRLVVGLHAEGGHVVLGAGLRQRGQDGDALGQADDLLVQPPRLLVGPASRAAASRAAARAAARVEKLEAGDAVLAGGVQNEPVLLPFLSVWGGMKSEINVRITENNISKCVNTEADSANFLFFN